MTFKDQHIFSSTDEMMAEQIRSFDWSKTSLGKPDRWPSNLSCALSFCLNTSLPVAIYWGKNMVALYNNSWSFFLGDKHPSALGKPASEIWKAHWDELSDQFQQVLNGQTGVYRDLFLSVSKNGHTQEGYFDFIVSPVYNDDGTVGGIFHTITETTSRVLSEQRNVYSKNFTLAIAESKTVDSLFEKGMQFISTIKDIAFALILHEDSDQISAASVEIREDEQDSALWRFTDVPDEGILFKIEQELVLRNRFVQHYPHVNELYVLPLRLQNYPVNYNLVFGLNPKMQSDESLRKFLSNLATAFTKVLFGILYFEKDLERLKAVEELDRDKTIFFNRMSHEFKIPLSNIRGNIEDIIKKQHFLSNFQYKELDFAYRNTLRLLHMVNTMISHSMIETGKMAAKFEKLDIIGITTDLAETFRSLIEKEGLKYSIDSKIDSLEVYADKYLWKKIVLNLITNAYKFTLEGDIAIRLSRDDHYFILDITDTGVGIPPRSIRQIFDKFHKVEQTRGRSFEGAGMGLSLVSELVQLHGGTITVNSELGRGTSFHVKIPLGKEHLPAEQLKKTPVSDEDNTEAFFMAEVNAHSFAQDTIQPDEEMKKPGIMIVESGSDLSQYLNYSLENYYQLVFETNGREAFKQVQHSLPDLVIADAMLPDLDCFALLENIKSTADTQHIPVILLTSTAGEDNVIRLLDAGADDLLLSPFSVRELLARIRATLRLSAKRKMLNRQLEQIISNLPVDVCLLKGSSFQLIKANESAMNSWLGHHRLSPDVPWKEIIPEMIHKDYEALLSNVWKTGQPFVSREAPLISSGGRTADMRYFNFMIQRTADKNGEPENLLISGVDVTEMVKLKNAIDSNRQELRLLLQEAPAAVTILEGANHITTLANEEFLKIVRRTETEVLGKPFAEVFPQLKESSLFGKIDEVWSSGKSFKDAAFPVNFVWTQTGKKPVTYFTLLIKPLMNTNGEVYSLMIMLTDVTADLLVRKQIDENEKQLRLITDAMPSMIAYVDRNLDYQFSNKAFLQWFRLEKENVIGKNIRRIHPSSLIRQFILHINEVLKGNPRQFEMEQVRSDHRKRVLSVEYLPDINSDGEVIGFYLVANDITERKIAERKILESEKEYRELTDSLPQLVWKTDANGRGSFASSRWEKYSGVSPDGLTSFYQIVHPDDRDGIMQIWNDCLLTGKTYKYECRLRGKDGTYRWFHVHGEPIRNHSGQIENWIGAFMDITERKEAEEKLAAREKELQNLQHQLEMSIAAGQIGVWHYDVFNDVLTWSKEQKQIYGLDEYDQVERAADFHHFVFPEDLAGMINQSHNAIGTEEQYYFRIRRKDGQQRWIHSRCKRQFNEAGQVQYLTGVNIDVTEQKREAERKDEFLRMVSHELKTPLTSIKGYVQVLLSMIRIKDENNASISDLPLQSSLSRINQQIDRLTRLVTEMLDLSRIEKNKLELRMETFKLGEMVEMTIHDIQHSNETHNIVIEKKADPVVMADKERIEQVLINLISNAMKYAQPGTDINVSIYIDDNDMAAVSIKDQGIGIDKMQLPKIFNRFYRAEGESQKNFTGFGIGLFIVREIMQRHQGEVRVESELGKGSVFTILLHQVK